MKNSTKFIALLILFVAVAMFSILPATAAVVSTPQNDKTMDNSIQIDAKYKKVNKITFNGNGGKIGSKNTASLNINNGAKIKKFPTTPKRSGFTFKGWYTKKTGGTKISVNTKPTKSVTYFAQWMKKTSSRTLTSEEKKLLGKWDNLGVGSHMIWGFYKDGSFVNVVDLTYSFKTWKGAKGFFSLKNGVLTTKAQIGSDNKYDYQGNLDLKGWRDWSAWETNTEKIKFGTDEDGLYVEIGSWGKFYKQ